VVVRDVIMPDEVENISKHQQLIETGGWKYQQTSATD
jgi:hypothetical protein